MGENKKDELFCAFEPKCGNRFLCEFTDSTGLFIQTFVIYSIDRPKCEINVDDSGKRSYKWLPIKVELYDPIVPSTAQSVWDHLRRDENFNITIKVLGPVGDVVEEWKIVNASIKSIDFGNLDWRAPVENKVEIHQSNVVWHHKGGGPVNITMMINYEYAQLIF